MTALNSGQLNDAQVATAFLFSGEFQQSMLDSYYMAFLDRSGDSAGEASWLSPLQSNQATLDSAALGFLASSEIRQPRRGGHPIRGILATDPQLKYGSGTVHALAESVLVPDPFIVADPATPGRVAAIPDLPDDGGQTINRVDRPRREGQLRAVAEFQFPADDPVDRNRGATEPPIIEERVGNKAALLLNASSVPDAFFTADYLWSLPKRNK